MYMAHVGYVDGITLVPLDVRICP